MVNGVFFTHASASAA